MKKRHELVLRRCEPSQRGGSEGSGCSSRRRGVVRYGECQKNHAASVGRHAVDGCREFMADGEDGTAAALRCAACGCHRSFHRRLQEPDDRQCSSVQYNNNHFV